MKGVYQVLEPHTEYKESIVSSAICEHLEAVSQKQITRLLISCPPQFGKSYVASIAWCLWDWINNPHRRFLNCSFKMSLATHFSLQCGRLFNSDWYQNSFALKRNLALVKQTEEYLENTEGGSRRATAMESATGFGVAGGVLIVDDPLPVNVSDDMRLQFIEHFHRGLSNRAGATGSIVVLGQRVHCNDLIGELDQLGTYEHLMLPNEYDPKRSRVTSLGWKDPRTQEGELLWPEVFDERRTKEAKKYGLTHYAGQYLQNPVRKGGNIFNREHFQTYTTDSFPREADLDATIIALDCSFSAGRDSDYVVVQCWSSKGSTFYLRDQVREKADFTRTKQILVDFCRKWPQARAKYIEKSSNGFAIIDTLKNSIPGIIPVAVGSTSKVSRYHAVAPFVAARNVYLPKHADWLEEFLLEAEAVPSSSHDDQIDCFAMAVNKLEGCVPHRDVFGQFLLI